MRQHSFFFFFLPRVDVPHVYVHALTLGCFHSLISTPNLLGGGADSVGGQLHGSKECLFSGVTKSARVWRKVPEGDAWSVGSWLPITQTVSANHNTTIDILRKTPKERLPWFSHKLKPQSMAWMTQKSGAKLMQVRVPSAARLFSPQVSFQCRLSYSVCLYSPRMQLHASTSVCMLKLPNTGSHITLFGHAKILHTLIGMGSAALVAAVLYPGKVTRMSRMGQRSA